MPNLTSLSISWRDILDVFIVSVLLFQIIVLVKGTRAITVILGLSVLFVVYFIARTLGLYTVSWILQHVFGSLFLVIIILFQRDIWQALGDIGTKSFWSRPAIKKDNIQSIALACEHMAKVRMGALIVIEKSMPLGDMLANAGVRVDAVISYGLILSIFNTKAPLHDGAIIISKGRIMAASCILPLAVVQNQELGTRHRAALGITEESDAMVIVVSEERGEICFANKGNLEINITKDRLSRMLADVI